MESLFRVKFNWVIFFALAFLIRLGFWGLSWYSYFAIILFLHQFLLLFFSMGSVIPIRYLFGTYMCLQMLVGPMLAYNGLDNFQFGYYKMQVPEDQYFSYVIPAVICFIIGLHLLAGRLKGEVIREDDVKKFVTLNPNLPFLFIFIGFVASFVFDYVTSELQFVFYLLAGLKFIGAFLLLISDKKLKLTPLVFVYGSIIASSLAGGMFHDLITWLVMLAAVLAIKYKPGIGVKLVFTFLFIAGAFILQLTKGEYREETWQKGEEAGIETFAKAYQENKEQGGLFDVAKIGKNNLRINQGYIIANIMKTVPEKVPYAHGDELRQILEAAFLPRIIAEDKLNAGDQEIFKKYSGIPLRKGTSMGLSSVGDAYVNFGVVGGCIFMFLLGLLFNFVLKSFHKYSKYYPVLILFVPLVFYYPIRPDCELQTVLGHLVKSCFLIFVIMQFWKGYFKAQRPRFDYSFHIN